VPLSPRLAAVGTPDRQLRSAALRCRFGLRHPCAAFAFSKSATPLPHPEASYPTFCEGGTTGVPPNVPSGRSRPARRVPILPGAEGGSGAPPLGRPSGGGETRPRVLAKPRCARPPPDGQSGPAEGQRKAAPGANPVAGAWMDPPGPRAGPPSRRRRRSGTPAAPRRGGRLASVRPGPAACGGAHSSPAGATPSGEPAVRRGRRASPGRDRSQRQAMRLPPAGSAALRASGQSSERDRATADPAGGGLFFSSAGTICATASLRPTALRRPRGRVALPMRRRRRDGGPPLPFSRQAAGSGPLRRGRAEAARESARHRLFHRGAGFSPIGGDRFCHRFPGPSGFGADLGTAQWYPRRAAAGRTARQRAPGPSRLRRRAFLASRAYSKRRAAGSPRPPRLPRPRPLAKGSNAASARGLGAASARAGRSGGRERGPLPPRRRVGCFSLGSGTVLPALLWRHRFGADPGAGRATNAPSPARRRSCAPERIESAGWKSLPGYGLKPRNRR